MGGWLDSYRQSFCCAKFYVNWDCMCRRDVESVTYLLLHCLVAYDLWCLIFLVFGMAWALSGKELLRLVLSPSLFDVYDLLGEEEE